MSTDIEPQKASPSSFAHHLSQQPRVNLLRAAGSAIVLTLLGFAVAPLALPHRSTAEVRLVVGDQTLSAQAVPGYAQATVTLAETYARFVTDGSILGDSDRDTSLAATVIPDNPVIRLTARADDDETAVRRARTASRSLVRAVALVTTNDVKKARAQFLRQQETADRTQGQVAQAKESAAAAPTDTSLQRRYRNLNGRARLQQLEANAAATALQNSLSAASGRATSLAVVSDAMVTDEGSQTRLLGGVFGFALAVIGYAVVTVLRTERAERTGQ